MLRVPVTRIKDMAAGRSRVPTGIWNELATFAQMRETVIERLRGSPTADADTMLAAVTDLPAGFPCLDTYVTAVAAAALTGASVRACERARK